MAARSRGFTSASDPEPLQDFKVLKKGTQPPTTVALDFNRQISLCGKSGTLIVVTLLALFPPINGKSFCIFFQRNA